MQNVFHSEITTGNDLAEDYLVAFYYQRNKICDPFFNFAASKCLAKARDITVLA